MRGAATYEVLALQYGTLESTWDVLYLEPRASVDSPTSLAYFFWVAVSDDRVVLIDTGFDPDVAQRRGRRGFVAPVELLARAGLGPDDVTDVIVSHFHYDHVGNARAFPRARFHASAPEYQYWVAQRSADDDPSVEPRELDVLAGIHDEGRLTLISPGAEPPIVDGIDAIDLNGHTPGQIGVRIQTGGAPVVLVSDAAHTAEQITRDIPVRVFTDFGDMKRSMAAVRQLVATGSDIVVFGHEPSDVARFPRWRGIDAVFQIS